MINKQYIYRASLIALFSLILMFAFLFASDLSVLWNKTLVWVFKTQAQLHKDLTLSLQDVNDHGMLAAWSLISLSFIYGVFHAVGPGHGKVLMTTYMGSHSIKLRRGLTLSTMAAILQGVVAILIVEAVVAILGYSLRQSSAVSFKISYVSFTLVALLGVILILKGGHSLYKRYSLSRHYLHNHSISGDDTHHHHHDVHDHCAHCDKLHQLANSDSDTSWKTDLVTILAIGIRPCTGAILILIAANSMGLRHAGILAVLAMSVGTAITVGALTAGVVSVRSSIMQRIGFKNAGLFLEIAAMVGGCIILLMGIGLIQQGLQTAPHPII